MRRMGRQAPGAHHGHGRQDGVQGGRRRGAEERPRRTHGRQDGAQGRACLHTYLVALPTAVCCLSLAAGPARGPYVCLACRALVMPCRTLDTLQAVQAALEGRAEARAASVQAAVAAALDAVTCSICADEPLSVVFTKCGHVYCERCANKIAAKRRPVCAQCNQAYVGHAKVFLPGLDAGMLGKLRA